MVYPSLRNVVIIVFVCVLIASSVFSIIPIPPLSAPTGQQYTPSGSGTVSGDPATVGDVQQMIKDAKAACTQSLQQSLIDLGLVCKEWCESLSTNEIDCWETYSVTGAQDCSKAKCGISVSGSGTTSVSCSVQSSAMCACTCKKKQ